MDPILFSRSRRPLLSNLVTMLSLTLVGYGLAQDSVKKAPQRLFRETRFQGDPLKAAAIRGSNAVRNERNYILQKKAKGQLKHNPKAFNPLIGLLSSEHCRVCQ